MTLFLFGRGLLSSRRRDRGHCHESSEAAGVGGEPPSLAATQGRETGGQLFTAPTDVSHFFFSSMETLNHISAFPAIYIGHDS